jgi:hypothetical protein
LSGKNGNGRESSDDTEPQTIDGETGKPDASSRRIDLSTLRDVRLEIAHVYRKVDTGEIDSRDGARRAYMLKTIHDVIVSAELERRIKELEEQQAIGSGSRPALLRHRSIN